MCLCVSVRVAGGFSGTSSVWRWGQKLKRDRKKETKREKKLAVIHAAPQVPTKAFSEIKHSAI